MIWTATCLSCGRIVWSTNDKNVCRICGAEMLTEEATDRDARLGITRDPSTWNKKDPLIEQERVICG